MCFERALQNFEAALLVNIRATKPPRRAVHHSSSWSHHRFMLTTVYPAWVSVRHLDVVRVHMGGARAP